MSRTKPPGIYRHGASWTYVVTLPRGADGKPRQEWKRGFPSQRAAEAARMERLVQIRGGDYLPPSDATLRDWLVRWLEFAAEEKTPPTERVYRSIIAYHIEPALGDLPLDAVRKEHLEAYLRGAARKDGRGPLSARTLRCHHAVLHQVFARAVELRLLARSPMDGVALPRFLERRFPVLSPDQTRRLLEEVADRNLLAPVLLATGTGMRKGEIIALEWSDCQLREDGGRLVVARSASRFDRQWYIGPPKGKRARDVVLPGYVAAGLLAVRGAQPPEWELVCPDPWGRRFNPSTICAHVHRALSAAGLPGVRFHDLRHGHASHLFELAVALPTIAARLGHSSTRITAQIYAHMIPGAAEEAARRLESMLAPGAASGAR